MNCAAGLMPPKRPASPGNQHSGTGVYVSEPIHDRKSMFIGYYSPALTKSKELQTRDEVKSASHRVLAWRQPSDQKTLLSSSRPVYRTGHDDDGENWAGRKLENLMDQLDVQGTLMVARWYGGELLGPVRFKHIEDVAKNAVDLYRVDKDGGPAKKARLTNDDQGSSSSPAAQTMRPDELARRKRELVATLQRRDESIAALRTLLEQKRAAERSPSASSSAAHPSPVKVLSYEVMPFNRLQPLENARDMTISFLLRQIDQAEAEAGKRVEEARKKADADAALRAVEDEFELDEGWEEMEEAMKEASAANG